MGLSLNSRVYNFLKPVATTVLPGLAALYLALAEIWGLPKAQEVVQTITAVNVFLGIVLNISSASYNRSDRKFDGDINVEEQPDGRAVFTLELNRNPDALEHKKEVHFKVNRVS